MLSVSAPEHRKKKHHPEEEKQDKLKENTDGNIKNNIQYNRNTCEISRASKLLKYELLYSMVQHSNTGRIYDRD